LDQLSEIIKAAVDDKGKSAAEVARKLNISSQLLGQYMNGRHKPKLDFYIKWKEVFNEDLLQVVETNVSHETNAEDNRPPDPSRERLERTLENMSEDKIRSTAIMERLVALLENAISSNRSSTGIPESPEGAVNTAAAADELRRTGRKGPFSVQKKGKQ
jgi:transcriptional regulator with XRE-family HTH domain